MRSLLVFIDTIIHGLVLWSIPDLLGHQILGRCMETLIPRCGYCGTHPQHSLKTCRQNRPPRPLNDVLSYNQNTFKKKVVSLCYFPYRKILV